MAMFVHICYMGKRTVTRVFLWRNGIPLESCELHRAPEKYWIKTERGGGAGRVGGSPAGCVENGVHKSSHAFLYVLDYDA